MGLSYAEALDYVYSFTNFERTPQLPYGPENYDLDRFRELLGRLGDPQDAVPSIHIAGTKGKGSVAALLTRMAGCAGRTTGTFTSPHLVTPRERIALDGNPIQPEQFAWAIEQVRDALQTGLAGGRASPPHRYRTTFEIFTAAALVLFRSRRVQLSILETGMGGRLDATNAVRPILSVITPISLDHTAALGETVEEIAREKAGILKPGVPAITGPQPPAVRAVLSARASEVAVPLELAQDRIAVRVLERRRTGTRVRFRTAGETAWTGRLRLLGDHQVQNARLAVAAWRGACSVLSFARPETADLARALETVRWPARFEIVRRGGRRRSWMIVDGAHNPASAEAFVSTLGDLFPGRRVTLVSAISANKPVTRILEILARSGADLVAPRLPHVRLLQPQELVRLARPWFPGARVGSSMAETLDRLREEHRDHRHVIAVVGSIFAAGSALTHLRDLHPEGP